MSNIPLRSSAMADLEIGQLKKEYKDLKDAWDSLCFTLVGNSGLSAILEAKRLREMHPLDDNH